ncbi:MAG: hypothetical protein K8R44_00880 [Sulfurimonas sp.]|nr:hypothetical protein [Sulfurimonas sp.]
MRKVITLGIASALSALVLAGRGAATSSKAPEAQEAHTGEINNKHMTQEKLHKIIKEAGENNGWKMTEFKSNAIIAEKIDGDDSTSVTVTFSKGSFDIVPANSDLEDAIKSALK